MVDLFRLRTFIARFGLALYKDLGIVSPDLGLSSHLFGPCLSAIRENHRESYRQFDPQRQYHRA